MIAPPLVIVEEAVAVHPTEFVIVTVYVPAPTEIVCVVAPVDQIYALAEVADRVMFVPQ